MKRPLHIGLRLPALGTFEPGKRGNIQGDEQVARAWAKYLLRRDDVRSVTLYDASSHITGDLDVLIHFNPFLDLHDKARNILYLQNVFPESHHAGGTVGVFRQVQSRYAGFLFTSRPLMQSCADGGVVPFATDPETFFPQPDTRYQVPVAFVGNDIRGGSINRRYFYPAMELGLVIYGNDWTPPLSTLCRGKLPMGDLPKLYSTASINLNAHIAEHIRFGTINLRLFDILACGGFVISDHSAALDQAFGEAVVCTDGHEDEWAKIVRYLSDAPERTRRSELGRKIVLDSHTYERRVDDLMTYLHAIL